MNDYTVESTSVTCDIGLEPGAEGVLRFTPAANGAPIDDGVPTLKERFTAFARRRLCEVRDNYLDRNPVLTGLARAGRNLLPRM